MVGTKLIQFKEVINHYLGLPYWRNKLKDGKVIQEGILGGKGNCRQIATETIKLAQNQNVDITKLTNQEFYNFQKKNHIGVDCSGLAYNLLDEYSQILTEKSIYEKVVGIDSKLGARRISANILTSPINSIPVDSYDDIKTGDLIRMDNGKHVVLVVEKNDNIITYVHSSEKTKIRGVHYGTIEITNPKKTLDYQKWSDITLKDINYNKLIFPKKGDGIYRLKCLA